MIRIIAVVAGTLVTMLWLVFAVGSALGASWCAGQYSPKGGTNFGRCTGAPRAQVQAGATGTSPAGAAAAAAAAAAGGNGSK